MNTFLLLLGLTVIYYVVLFYFDNKRKKAFQLTQKNAIGKTAELPLIEEIKPDNLFGATNQIEIPKEVTPAVNTIAQKVTAAKNRVNQHFDKNVEEDLDELALHLETAETIEMPKEKLIEKFQKAGEQEMIGETEIDAFIQSPKLASN